MQPTKPIEVTPDIDVYLNSDNLIKIAVTDEEGYEHSAEVPDIDVLIKALRDVHLLQTERLPKIPLTCLHCHRPVFRRADGRLRLVIVEYDRTHLCDARAMDAGHQVATD